MTRLEHVLRLALIAGPALSAAVLFWSAYRVPFLYPRNSFELVAVVTGALALGLAATYHAIDEARRYRRLVRRARRARKARP